MQCRRWVVLAWVAVVVVAAPSDVWRVAAGERPNVVLLLADDLGYGELSSYGGNLPTPHIDSLAAAGVRFTDGYVTAPFCAASRAGLLTGRYQTRFGFELNPIGPRNDDPRIGLPVEQRTIADRLRDAGYATGLVGKWHLGATALYHPQRRGFDEFYGFLHEGHYFVPPPWKGVTTWLRRKTLPDGSTGRWTSPDGQVIWSTHMGYHEPDYDANNPMLRNSQPVDEREHLTDAMTREARDFIRRHHQQPFFLFLSYNAVHSPMQATDATLARFPGIDDVHRRIFAAMLAHLDDSVGQVLTTLDECGVADNTLVVFLSDNGGPTRELTSSNSPLRGEKGQLYEGGIRVPFLVRWTDQLPSGKTYERTVSSLDLLPTILAAAGVDVRDTDGVDLLPYLDGQNPSSPHAQLYWRVGTRAAWRQGDWKIVRHRSAAAAAAGRGWELFDLSQDVGEQYDQAEQQPDRLRALLAAWSALDAEMVAPLW